MHFYANHLRNVTATHMLVVIILKIIINSTLPVSSNNLPTILPSRGLAQILPISFRRPFMKGRAQQAEQDSKMFKNMKLNQFLENWTLTFSVNLSSSETMLVGAAS